MAATDVLKNLGFKEQSPKEFQQISDDLDLSRDDNPHKVLSVFSNGKVTALFEKNVSPDNSGGVEVIMKHPPVLIIEGPNGRTAISNYDEDYNVDLIANVVKAVS